MSEEINETESPEVQEGTPGVPEGSEIKVGDTPVDAEHEAGLAAGVKEAVRAETVISAETDGTGPTEEPPKRNVTTKMQNKHQRNQKAFWAEQERKKKLAEEKAKK